MTINRLQGMYGTCLKIAVPFMSCLFTNYGLPALSITKKNEIGPNPKPYCRSTLISTLCNTARKTLYHAGKPNKPEPRSRKTRIFSPSSAQRPQTPAQIQPPLRTRNRNPKKSPESDKCYTSQKKPRQPLTLPQPCKS